MQKYLLILILASSHIAFAQNNLSDSNIVVSDSTPNIISGYKWGVIPTLAYDADIGFKYGGNINVFDYGNGDKYPDYLQYLYIKLLNSTKNTSQVQLLFNSDKIIKKTRLVAEFSYIVDKNLNFLGFNGINAIYNEAFTDASNQDYINQYYYTQQRRLFRGRLDIQKNIFIPQISLFAGFTFSNYENTSTDFNKFSAPSGPNDNPAEEISLYQQYVTWGVIGEEEKSGGNISYFNLGFIYDSRNNQRVSTSGLWVETFALVSPKHISDQSFSKFIFSFRQYLTLPKTNIVFSYRLSSQSKMKGDIPYYLLPTYFESLISRDGLGGAYNLRGITRNRIVSDGFVLGNFELRKKVASTRILKLNFDFHLAVFSDAAYIIQEHKLNLSNVPEEWKDQLFDDRKQNISATYGLGLYIIYNANNIMSVYYGFPSSKQLGNGGLYVGSSFLF